MSSLDNSTEINDRRGYPKILEIFEGANELQQWIVARQLIGRDVTG
jgi:hypothetical protein